MTRWSECFAGFHFSVVFANPPRTVRYIENISVSTRFPVRASSMAFSSTIAVVVFAKGTFMLMRRAISFIWDESARYSVPLLITRTE